MGRHLIEVVRGHLFPTLFLHGRTSLTNTPGLSPPLCLVPLEAGNGFAQPSLMFCPVLWPVCLMQSAFSQAVRGALPSSASDQNTWFRGKIFLANQFIWRLKGYSPKKLYREWSWYSDLHSYFSLKGVFLNWPNKTSDDIWSHFQHSEIYYPESSRQPNSAS